MDARRESGGYLILLVEDNPVSQTIAAQQLLHHGYRVHIARTGHEALSALAERQYDLVLMDCMLPEMDGYETTRRIRSAETGHTPVIGFTAQAFPDSREQCLAAGMDDYLSKPYREEELIKAISCWIPESGPDSLIS